MKKILFTILSIISVFALVACSNTKETEMESKTETMMETTLETNAESMQETMMETNETTVETKSEGEVKYHNIIAGSTTVAEYLDALGVDIVGVSSQDNTPKRYMDVTKVGAPRKLDYETIVSLNPDLFIGDKLLEDLSVEDLKNQNIETLYLSNSNIDEIKENINTLAELFGKQNEAKRIITNIDNKVESAVSNAKDLKEKKVVVLFGTGEDYLLATKTSFIGGLLEELKLDNIANYISKDPRSYVPFSLEKVIEQNPDYILTLSHGHKELMEQAFKEELAKDLWKSTNAVINGKVYALDDQKFPVTGNIHIGDILMNLKDLLENGE